MGIQISTGVAEVVIEKLREQDRTQVQLSELSGIPRTTLQRRLLDGDFTVSELSRVASVLGTTPDAILAAASDTKVEVVA